MKLVLAGAWVLAALSLPAYGQDDKKKPDDVLQKKDGGIIVGRIQKLETEYVEILVNGEKDARKVSLRDLHPHSVYKIRLDRIDRNSGDAHFALGEFCMANGLYPPAAKEFEEAGRLDKSLEEKAHKRRDEAHNEDGRSRFEEAKRMAAERKYDEGNKSCQLLVEKYGDTPYADEARRLIAKIAEDVAKENEAKKKQLEDKKEAQEKKKAVIAESQEKDALAKTAEMIDDAAKLWQEGLDGEAKNLTRGEKAWRGAEGAILAARRNIEFLLKSNDLETIKKAKEMERACDAILVKVYYRLGRMWAVELNYPVALEWLNKAMKVPHDEQMDRQINEILLTISQLKMKERAAGKGY
jgi:tetratricopeptide (TPR) repeat protein